MTGGNVRMIDMQTGAAEIQPGEPSTLRFDGLPATAKDVEIWLPHNEVTELVALRTDAPVEPLPDGGPQGLAAPRQLDQPRLRRREPDHDLAGDRCRSAGESSWSTSGSAGARCSTRSPRAPCATPRQT